MIENLKDFSKYKHSQVTWIFIEMLIRRFPTIASAAPMKIFCENKIIIFKITFLIYLLQKQYSVALI